MEQHSVADQISNQDVRTSNLVAHSAPGSIQDDSRNEARAQNMSSTRERSIYYRRKIYFTETFESLRQAGEEVYGNILIVLD